jgi:hypothetical protein
MLGSMIQLVERDPGKPADFAENNYIYIPSLPTAIVALVIWVVIWVAIVYRSYRFKVWYLSVMLVGLTSMAFCDGGVDGSGDDRLYHAGVWSFSLECV